MTIRHLKTFIAVCEAGGITKAAERLHIAQPSVSQTIAELEKYYNVMLFERINQRLVITEQGRILLEKAKEVSDSFDEFENIANLSDLNPSVRIGASLTVGKIFIPALLEAVSKRCSGVTPFVEISKTAAIEEKILNGDIDFGIVEGMVSSPVIRSVPFGHDKLAVVCGAGYVMPDRISVSDLTEYRLFLRERGSASRDMLDNVLSLRGLRVTPMMESVSNSAIISSVRRGLGVTVLPYELVLPYISSKELRLIETDASFERQTYLIFHKNKKFTARQSEIYRLCFEIAKV